MAEVSSQSAIGPHAQADSNISTLSKGMRCVPDASANADPNSGYTIIVKGAQQTIGGTSAVAPLLAGWKAACDSVAGKILPFSAASVYQCVLTCPLMPRDNDGCTRCLTSVSL